MLKRKIIQLMLTVSMAALTVCSTSWAETTPEIVLGAITSLNFLEGRESLNAVRLAVDEINAKGGVKVKQKTHMLRVIPMDLEDARPDIPVSVSLNRLEKMIAAHRIHAIVIGPFRSEVLLAGMDIIAGLKIPLIGTIAMSPATDAKILRNPEYRYIFRTCLNVKYLVDYLINTMKFIRQRYGFDKVYIMNQDVAWARTAASLMIRLYLDRSDWSIVGLDNFSSGVTDFTQSLSRAESKQAQIILPIFDMPESSMLVKQWHNMRGKSLLFGFISPMVGSHAWESFDGKIAGALNVIFEMGNIPSPRWKPSMDFYNAYKAKFGQDIQAGHGPAPAYESVYILVDAVRRADSLDPESIVAALESTDRTGAMGRIRFHRGHQVIFGDDPQEDALACIFQWQSDGSRKIVFPLSVADGEIEMPF